MFHTTLSKGKHIAQGKEKAYYPSPSEKDRKRHSIRVQVKRTKESLLLEPK